MTTIKIIGDRLLIRRKQKALSDTLAIPDAVAQNNPERHFEAEVVEIGNALTEDVKAGDSIIVAHCGSQKVSYRGETLELISMLDVVGIGTL